MSADNFHHIADQSLKKKKQEEDFADFVEYANLCGKTLVMKHKSCLIFPLNVSRAKYASKIPKFENVHVVTFTIGSNKMYWKTKHSQKEFQGAQFLQKKYIKYLGTDFKCA